MGFDFVQDDGTKCRTRQLVDPTNIVSVSGAATYKCQQRTTNYVSPGFVKSVDYKQYVANKMKACVQCSYSRLVLKRRSVPFSV